MNKLINPNIASNLILNLIECDICKIQVLQQNILLLPVPMFNGRETKTVNMRICSDCNKSIEEELKANEENIQAPTQEEK